MGCDGVDLQAQLTEVLHRPTAVANDADLAALDPVPTLVLVPGAQDPAAAFAAAARFMPSETCARTV